MPLERAPRRARWSWFVFYQLWNVAGIRVHAADKAQGRSYLRGHAPSSCPWGVLWVQSDTKPHNWGKPQIPGHSWILQRRVLRPAANGKTPTVFIPCPGTFNNLQLPPGIYNKIYRYIIKIYNKIKYKTKPVCILKKIFLLNFVTGNKQQELHNDSLGNCSIYLRIRNIQMHPPKKVTLPQGLGLNAQVIFFWWYEE